MQSYISRIETQAWLIKCGLFLLGTLGMAFDANAAALETHRVESFSLSQVYDFYHQPDGKIVVAGKFKLCNGVMRNNLARLNTDGSLDDTFNVPVGDGVYAMVGDGTNLFIGGAFTNIGTQARSRLAKIRLADGALDAAFTNGASSMVVTLALSGTNLFVGGWFTNIGGQTRIRAARLHTEDSAVNPDFNTGFSNTVRCLAVDGTNLFVGGDFTKVGSSDRSHIAKVDFAGTVDMAFTNGASGNVYSLLVDGASLFVGGYFTHFAGQAHGYIAKVDTTEGNLDGTFTGEANDTVYGLALNGSDLYVGGYFWEIGGLQRWSAARINKNSGAASAAFTAQVQWGPVRCFAIDGDALLLGGDMTTVNGAYAAGMASVDRLTGAVNTNFAGGVADPGWVYDIHAQADGKVVLCGVFDAVDGVPRSHVARLNADGTVDMDWDPDADANGASVSLPFAAGVFIGGSFNDLGGGSPNCISRVNLTNGAPDAAFIYGANNAVYSLAYDSQALYAAGSFSTIGGASRSKMAKLNPTTGAADASFTNGLNNWAGCLLFTNNSLYVGGTFTTVGGTPVARIAKLNPMDGAPDMNFCHGASSTVYTLGYDGQALFAGGMFSNIGGAACVRLARLDPATGAASPPFTNAVDDTVSSLALGGNDLFIGGSFANVGAQACPRLARLSKSHGRPDAGFTNGVDDSVYSLCLHGNKIYVGGKFASADGVASPGLVAFSPAPSAPCELAASSLTATDCTLTWPLVWSADAYYLDVACDSGFSSFVPGYNNRTVGNVLSCQVTGLTAASTYYIRLRASNAQGVSPSSGSTNFLTTPSAPQSVTAGDGEYFDRVRITWDSVAGAVGYSVWRHTENNSSLATLVDLQTGTWVDDAGAIAGVMYYYWVRATNASGPGAFSAPDTGWRRPTTPSAPLQVAASDGTFTGCVQVAWNASADATGYTVWRYTADNSGGAVAIGATAALSFDDNSAELGKLYYYWVKATNLGGVSAFSDSDSGYRMTPPAAPTGVSASAGAYNDQVRVIWNDVADATSFQVWRHTANNSAAAVLLDAVAAHGGRGSGMPPPPCAANAASGAANSDFSIQLSALAYADTGVAGETTYYYWVKAVNAAGASAFSAMAAGYPGVVGPLVSVNGLIGDNVVVAQGTPLTIAVEMMNLPAAHLGHNVDWWVAAYAQSSGAWYYLNPAMAWMPFDGDLTNMHPAYQGRLMDLPSHVLTQGLTLAPGAYNIWFAVDYPMDGVLHLTPGQYLMSRVTVTVE